jgi:serine/threonine-protein kinase SRPK3
MIPTLGQSLKDEESAAEYRKGGYLPVTVGDRFAKDRYAVVRKLGYDQTSFLTPRLTVLTSWGHFSTVWLVKDEQ